MAGSFTEHLRDRDPLPGDAAPAIPDDPRGMWSVTPGHWRPVSMKFSWPVHRFPLSK